MKKISVVIFGVGGYGAKIGENVLDHLEDYGIRLVGVVEPYPDASRIRDRLLAAGVPFFATGEEFYAAHRADLAILCTPIPFHEEHCRLATENGSVCLCEKPTAATLLQSQRMEAQAKKTKKSINVGFQLSYVPSVLRLKKDVMAGVLGKPLSLSALVSWPRDDAYYSRSWCSKIRWQGQYVLDSIAMNACAHYLHLMLFLLGDALSLSADPEEVEAFLAKAREIETFDTAALRIRAGGANLSFLATHAGEERIDPVMRFVFEKATVELREKSGEDAVRAVFSDGSVKCYGTVREDFFCKIPYCCDVARGKKEPICTPETASAHLKLVNAVTERVPVFSFARVKKVDGFCREEGLSALWRTCFENNKMPWEITDRYGKPTLLSLKDYTWEDRI